MALVNEQVKIIAGACSTDEDNKAQLFQIAGIPGMYGERLIGLKSRSGLSEDGKGMGMDFPAVKRNMELLTSGKRYAMADLEQLPSIDLAGQLARETGLTIASEIMLPSMQMPLYERAGLPAGKLLAWNPSVNQLGWPQWEMAMWAARNGWQVGFKNPKWAGDDLAKSEAEGYQGETPMENTWRNLVSYAAIAGKPALIQRGVLLNPKELGDYRNIPVHRAAMRVKKALQAQGQNVEMYFDPSHSFGPKLRDQIASASIAALGMMLSETEFLYDGLLIEAGKSKTDTNQHVTLDELRWIVEEVAKFRVPAPRTPLPVAVN